MKVFENKQYRYTIRFKPKGYHINFYSEPLPADYGASVISSLRSIYRRKGDCIDLCFIRKDGKVEKVSSSKLEKLTKSL